MKYKTFKDFLISKHADHYHGVDDDMPDDFERWLYNGLELERKELIKYADEYTAIQRQEIEKEETKRGYKPARMVELMADGMSYEEASKEVEHINP